MPQAGGKNHTIELLQILQDLGLLEHDVIHRPRPYPYDVGAALTVNDGGAINTFGAYTELILINTYDFGDPNNRVQIVALCVSAMSANASYLLEFYKFIDAQHIPLGAVRWRRAAAVQRSFLVNRPCRPFSSDETALYARLKTSVATGENVQFNLLVARYLPTSVRTPVTTGPWPFG